uniref:Uncharacterized protein n=1 Tax=Anguilla anguilla TaxID=7936 RepID=A0A0E9RIK4_ANGAN
MDCILCSAFIQNALQLMPLIHPFTHTHTPTLAPCMAAFQSARWGAIRG